MTMGGKKVMTRGRRSKIKDGSKKVLEIQKCPMFSKSDISQNI
jgi:hypothetical protein